MPYNGLTHCNLCWLSLIRHALAAQGPPLLQLLIQGSSAPCQGSWPGGAHTEIHVARCADVRRRRSSRTDQDHGMNAGLNLGLTGGHSEGMQGTADRTNGAGALGPDTSIKAPGSGQHNSRELAAASALARLLMHAGSLEAQREGPSRGDQHAWSPDIQQGEVRGQGEVRVCVCSRRALTSTKGNGPGFRKHRFWFIGLQSVMERGAWVMAAKQETRHLHQFEGTHDLRYQALGGGCASNFASLAALLLIFSIRKQNPGTLHCLRSSNSIRSCSCGAAGGEPPALTPVPAACRVPGAQSRVLDFQQHREFQQDCEQLQLA
eukprot:1148733-Pelagomonas_calceolata.AAC.6